MKSLTSTEFRKAYATLTETTVVTVNGHQIGTWTPGYAIPSMAPAALDFVAALETKPPTIQAIAPIAKSPAPRAQAQRDEWLRRLAK